MVARAKQIQIRIYDKGKSNSYKEIATRINETHSFGKNEVTSGLLISHIRSSFFPFCERFCFEIQRSMAPFPQLVY